MCYGGEAVGRCIVCGLKCASLQCSCNCGCPEGLFPLRKPEYNLTCERHIEIVHAFCDVDMEAIRAIEWNEMSDDDKRVIDTLLRYELSRLDEAEQRRLRAAPQRRARKLLWTLLNPEQTAQLRRNKRHFHVRGSAGGMYRLNPVWGNVWQCTRFGSRWVRTTRFCIHDNGVMPPADHTIGHMLWLMADEPGFLAEANASKMYLPA